MASPSTCARLVNAVVRRSSSRPAVGGLMRLTRSEEAQFAAFVRQFEGETRYGARECLMRLLRGFVVAVATSGAVSAYCFCPELYWLCRERVEAERLVGTTIPQ